VNDKSHRHAGVLGLAAAAMIAGAALAVAATRRRVRSGGDHVVGCDLLKCSVVGCGMQIFPILACSSTKIIFFIFALRTQPQQYWIIFSTRRDGIL
jgi:hypothetical protein